MRLPLDVWRLITAGIVVLELALGHYAQAAIILALAVVVQIVMWRRR